MHETTTLETNNKATTETVPMETNNKDTEETTGNKETEWKMKTQEREK